MSSAANYRRLALDCLVLAESTGNPETRNACVRMAELCAKRADRNESDRVSGARGADGQVA
jgi:hypothetical protein